MTFVAHPITAVLTDERGYVIGSSGTTPIPVNPAESGAVNMATAQTTVASTATQIAAANATRRAVLITNTHATVTVYLGSAAVTTSTGQALPAGASITIPFTGAVYGIVASSTLVATSVDTYD